MEGLPCLVLAAVPLNEEHRASKIVHMAEIIRDNLMKGFRGNLAFLQICMHFVISSIVNLTACYTLIEAESVNP